MEVLAAFIREHSREQWPPAEPGAETPERATRPDIQAAVTVIGRRNPRHDRQTVDRHNAVLIRADLTGAHLAGADLNGAHLDGAHLARADLGGTNLTGATFAHANLTEAQLATANLTGVLFYEADLTGARLDLAVLTRAVLHRVNLTGVVLADVKWPEGAPIPEGWMVDSDSGLLKRIGRLSEVMTHYL